MNNKTCCNIKPLLREHGANGGDTKLMVLG